MAALLVVPGLILFCPCDRVEGNGFAAFVNVDFNVPDLAGVRVGGVDLEVFGSGLVADGGEAARLKDGVMFLGGVGGRRIVDRDCTLLIKSELQQLVVMGRGMATASGGVAHPIMTATKAAFARAGNLAI